MGNEVPFHSPLFRCYPYFVFFLIHDFGVIKEINTTYAEKEVYL